MQGNKCLCGADPRPQSAHEPIDEANIDAYMLICHLDSGRCASRTLAFASFAHNYDSLGAYLGT